MCVLVEKTLDRYSWFWVPVLGPSIYWLSALVQSHTENEDSIFLNSDADGKTKLENTHKCFRHWGMLYQCKEASPSKRSYKVLILCNLAFGAIKGKSQTQRNFRLVCMY